MLAAVAAGAEVLRAGGSALDAVVATVRALEDHPLFNAGVGSLLTVEGTVEMDASVMVALPPPPRPRRGAASAAAAGRPSPTHPSPRCPRPSAASPRRR
jgi:beta-aspartyl-peptidase (threonine type)